MAGENKKGFLPSEKTAKEMNAPKVDSKHVEDFKTPEQVAAEDVEAVNIEMTSEDPIGMKQKLKNYYKKNKKACNISAVLILLIFGFTAYILLKPDTQLAKASPSKVIKKVLQIKTVPSNLTGLQVDASVNERPVTGVMIENSPAARPQSGLSEAGVVFEAIAEGGITRFLALYQDNTTNNVGPIRSARPYYALWALGFDAGYAHVGGSPEALSNIKHWGVRDLDQFANSDYYHRISEREAPHNVYTSIKTLNKLEKNKGYTHSKYTGFTRKEKGNPTKTPTVANIHIKISGPDYNVDYKYNPDGNNYKRWEGGEPHIDAYKNTQIRPNVVVAMVMDYSIQSDGYHSMYTVIDRGKAFIFQNGKVVTGTWKKKSNQSSIRFTSDSGVNVDLVPGQTWLTAIASKSDITYGP